MKILLRSILLLAIALSANAPSAFSMMRAGAAENEKKANKEKDTSAQQQSVLDRTAAARRLIPGSEGSDEGNALDISANTKRGTAVTTRDETYGKATKGEESLSDKEQSWPVKMPAGFSETEREWLQQDLKKISPEKLYQHNSTAWKPSKKTQEILNRWETKGVTIDPDFVADATAMREDAEKKPQWQQHWKQKQDKPSIC